MKKNLFILFILLFACAMFAQTITINSIGMHKDGEPGNFDVSTGDVVKVNVMFTAEDVFGVQSVHFNNIADKVMLYGFAAAQPALPPNFGAQTAITVSSYTDTSLEFKFTLPQALNSNSFQLTFGMSGTSSIDWYSNVNGTIYSSYATIGTFNAADTPATGIYRSYLTQVDPPPIEVPAITASAVEYNPSDALLGYNNGNYQPIGYVSLKTSTGTAILSNIKFDVGGTIDGSDASRLALYETPYNDFSGAILASNIATFTGTGQYSFPTDNRSITTNEKYYFLAISLNSTGLTHDDYITLSINDSYITTSATVNSYTPGVFAEKHLYKALVIGYEADFPSIAPGSPNAPFFRLNARTNDCSTSITSINFNLEGTLTTNDVINGGFKLWESTTPTFNSATAAQLGGDANYNELLIFSGFESIVNCTTDKYYFLTVSTRATANIEHTIGADIQSPTSIATTGNTVVNSLTGFPLTGEQHTLPVELSSFTASVVSDNAISINWTVESETGLSGYYILKSNSNNLDTAVTIPALIHAINTTETYTYNFIDSEIDFSKEEYYYWLSTVELSNVSETFGPIMLRIENVESDDVPFIGGLGTALIGNYPNPFNPSTAISFSLEKPEHVVINIYNIKGQLIKNLYNENVSTVNQRIDVLWDGKNNDGSPVASGIYYSRMVAGKYSESKKMILMK